VDGGRIPEGPQLFASADLAVLINTLHRTIQGTLRSDEWWLLPYFYFFQFETSSFSGSFDIIIIIIIYYN
jgi:hypothetical protein